MKQTLSVGFVLKPLQKIRSWKMMGINVCMKMQMISVKSKLFICKKNADKIFNNGNFH